MANVAVGGPQSGATYDYEAGEVFVLVVNTVNVILDENDSVVASIPVDNNVPWYVPQPSATLAYDGSKGEVFVPDSGTHNVSVISDAYKQVVATIPVGATPVGVAYDSGKGEIFVANAGSNNVSVISDSTNKVVANVPVGTDSFALAYDPAKGEVFVASGNSENVSVISDETNTVVATISAGGSPLSATFDSGDGELFVAVGFNVIAVSDATNGVTVTAHGTPSTWDCCGNLLVTRGATETTLLPTRQGSIPLARAVSPLPA